ncbi:asparaginase [Agreia sp. VKM Ac-1783]|uniref:asparaginase n=1 Tax=Agreia sp. VKM Ac-1783 TaxID=1938889 RepID=UPI000A2AE12B|nr:asparaginase [Agreia sp. VKM Ac-1783]SMQ68048.1 asparaginase [Agreia sp. VKM Ac-1783]
MTSTATPASQAASLGTFSIDGAVELAVLERSGFIESRHVGAAVVLDPSGTILEEFGDAAAPVFPRSSLKPFQALAIREAGVRLDPLQTALSMASHGGTPEHVDVVRQILQLASLDETALGCPADWPGDRAARDAVVRAGGSAERVYMNCSGKHAAMLLACVQQGWSTADYLDPAHPLQRRIRDLIEEQTEEKIAASGVDGCGAPVHAISLRALARGVSRIAQGETPDAEWLVDSVLANGWAVDSPKEQNTLVIDELQLFAKLGAEGVMVMSTRSGVAVALKILDGSLRAAAIVALELLVRAGAVKRSDVDSLVSTFDLAVLGGGQPVGSIRVTV